MACSSLGCCASIPELGIRDACPQGPVIPAKAGIQLYCPFIEVPPTPITLLDHLDFSL